MHQRINTKAVLKAVSKAIPLGIIFFLMVLFLFSFDEELTVESLLNYAPENYIIAALFIIAMFALKSLSVLLPIPVLYICTGFIFTPPIALLINIVGAAITTTIPYWIGRYSGSEFVDKIISRYNKTSLINKFKKDNEFFFSFVIRVVGFLPCDVISLLIGSFRFNYKKYMAGTILGMLPGLVSVTFMGASITKPLSWQFLVSSAAAVVISLTSTIIYLRVLKNKAVAKS